MKVSEPGPNVYGQPLRFPKIRSSATYIFKYQTIWLLLLVIVIAFGILSPVFLTGSNLSNILLSSTVYGILALGMTLLMINGNIDLSIGALMAFSATLAIGLQPYGIIAAVTAALLAGIILGALNGFFVAYIGINSFIVTLAAMIGIRGLVYIYGKGESIIGTNLEFMTFGNSSLLGIPYVALLFLLLAAGFQYMLSHTVHGRNAYAIGGGKESAMNAGIQVKRHMFANYVMMGLIAAIAGIIFASRMNAVTPTIGEGYELTVLTAIILGGVSFKGGYGNIFHAVGGVMVISILQNGMSLMNVQTYYSMLIMGAILIIVVPFNQKKSLSKS